MNLLISKGLKTLLFTIALFAAINTQAMEKLNKEQDFCQAPQGQTDNVVERIYNAFSKQLEARFTESPKTFNEAIVRIKCIAASLEKSEIKFRENFNATQNKCIINDLEQPYHMLHPIFKNWFDEACNNILLEHPKSVEAINTIFTKLNNNVSQENLELYHKAVNSLPEIIAEHIKEKFIDMHGWPYNNKSKIKYDNTGNIKKIKFYRNQYYVIGELVNNLPIITVMDSDKNSIPYSAYATHPTLYAMLSDLLNNFFHITLPESGVYPPLWEKPTFEKALEKRAEENKTGYKKIIKYKRTKEQSKCIIS